ncbi:UvrB/UvrC motif-containing protein [Clostridium cylindrosporum]|uniref:UvrB/UvrC protein n=1 Tax=Clostridium cylindrosporum DSM 605 TaxID=1121307 RepID=A0A0J8D8Q1_CLOCY|nr:UvrB/UvrC motif-containing protein [Clostridium cylindrosporum]KMT22435.1 UvrB/UvrC protein [Clostridium cylindrosporum DSM 605]
MFGDAFIFEPLGITNYKRKVCPLCNMDIETYKRTGRLGCSKCYEIFNEDLNPIIKRIHGKTEHIGKTPSKVDIKLNNELDKLKKELNLAVEREDYIEAARLRDLIKKKGITEA